MSYKKVPWCNPKLTPACAALKASDLLLPKVHGKHTVLPKHCCASSNESPHVAALPASHVHYRRHKVLPRHTETHLYKAFGTSLAALRLGHRRYSGQPTAAAPALLHAWALQQALTLPLTCRPLPPLAAGSLPQGASPPPGCPLTLTLTPGALCVACTPHASSTRRTFSAGWGAPPVAGLHLSGGRCMCPRSSLCRSSSRLPALPNSRFALRTRALCQLSTTWSQ